MDFASSKRDRMQLEERFVPTNKQRRDASRRHLERQLQRREEREAARKRFTLIASIVGSIVLIVVVAVFVVAVSGEDKNDKKTAGASPTATATGSTTPLATPSVSYPPAKGASVSFDGVTVKGAADLGGAPGVTSKASSAPPKLAYKDLVVGKGKAATPTSAVTVQDVGVLYRDGTVFDSSWSRGQAAQFSLSGVIKGFTQGIGGTTGVVPMKVGGRRIMILPAALGYGAAGSGSTVPPNAPLVFVVDLKSVGA